MAKTEDPVTQLPVTAVVKIDAQHPDETAVLLDEEGIGAQILAVDGNAVVLQAVVGVLVAAVTQDSQRHVGQGGADFPAADVIVGNGDDGTVTVGQIVESNLVIRAKGDA